MKKRLSLFLPVILLGIIALLYFARTGSASDISNMNSISREDARTNYLSEQLVTTLKLYESVDDAIVNTEATPIQIKIMISDSNPLSPEAKTNIEKLISHVLPDSTVEYAYV